MNFGENFLRFQNNIFRLESEKFIDGHRNFEVLCMMPTVHFDPSSS